MERTLGIVGSGNIGAAVAWIATAAGFNVVISNSRGPSTLAGLVEELAPRVRAGTVSEAARAGDATLIAIPFFRFPELSASDFAGRIVIDAMNFDPNRDHAVQDRLVHGMAPAKLLQRHLDGAAVVKAFSNIYAGHIVALAQPDGSEDRTALPIAGDDIESKRVVASIIEALGFDTVDAGGLDATSTFDLGTPAFVQPYLRDGDGEWWTRLESDPGAPLSSGDLRARLAA